MIFREVFTACNDTSIERNTMLKWTDQTLVPNPKPIEKTELRNSTPLCSKRLGVLDKLVRDLQAKYQTT